MRNLLLLALLASLLITSACKKTSTNPSGTNGYGTYKLGDSTYTVTSYSYAGGQVNINPNNTTNHMVIDFVSPNIPPASGIYPFGTTNPGQASFAVVSSYYGSFQNGNTPQNLTISSQSNGYLNYNIPTTWVYLYGTSSDSLPFSMNVTIPN
jgi:opacity protein-like surface antigen